MQSLFSCLSTLAPRRVSTFNHSLRSLSSRASSGQASGENLSSSLKSRRRAAEEKYFREEEQRLRERQKKALKEETIDLVAGDFYIPVKTQN